VLPLDGAARAMLRYVLPPVWKKELDEVEGERSAVCLAAALSPTAAGWLTPQHARML